MHVNEDLLRELDPRKSYDRGPMALPASGVLRDAGAAGAGGGSRIEGQFEIASTWTGREMSESVHDLSSLSLEELRRELKRREDAVARLHERRARIVAELSALDAEIRRHGGGSVLASGASHAGEAADGATPRPQRSFTPRPRNTLSLAEALTAAVDAGAIVTPRDAAELVKQTGYQTHSKTFVQTVTVALSKHTGFRRVDRGRYECIR